jgi:asparagine N-glycosylation enzyme membrane subunit Stt3
MITVFIFVRIPGLNLPYHQDENAWLSHGSWAHLGGSGHPPLGEIIYLITSKTVGYYHFRVTPFVFGILNLIVLFLFVRYRFGFKEAAWSALFFSISFFNVLASLMVDTDGQFLPAFFLLSVFSFYKW